MGDSSFDDNRMIAARLVDESGCNICGGLATSGNPATPTAWVRRSFTTCRASSRSVPGSNVMITDDKPGSDTDSMSWRNATPFSRSCSSGTVMNCSTSSADKPRASVWTSTTVGLNSGNSARGAFVS